MNNREFVRWGAAGAWAHLLGVPDDVVRERCRRLPMVLCRVADPKDPERTVIAEAYAEPDVRKALSNQKTYLSHLRDLFADSHLERPNV